MDAIAVLRRHVESWAKERFGSSPARDSESAVRHLVRKMAEAGFLDFHFDPRAEDQCVAGIDLSAACVVREVLARRSCVADQVFMDQLCGSLVVAWFGGLSLRDRVRPLVAQGKWLPGIVLPRLARQLSCSLRGDEIVIDGVTDWVANAGVANSYVVFATTHMGSNGGLTAMIIDRDAEGVAVLERVCASGAVPLGEVGFNACRVPIDHLLGQVRAANEVLRICQHSMELSRDASRLGQAQREIDRQAHMRVTTDLVRLRCDVQEEASRIYRVARRLTVDGALRPVRAMASSRAVALLQHACARPTTGMPTRRGIQGNGSGRGADLRQHRESAKHHPRLRVRDGSSP
jgi:alkylation response protein AidB-like acyl-CoA dehydrogenase